MSTARAALSPELIENLDSPEGIQSALQNAIELEHATIPPYLYALYSLAPGKLGKDGPDPAPNAEIIDLIGSIVGEEMAHLALACNILNAIGGTPQIDSASFVPAYPSHLPGGVDGSLTVHLQPFSKDAVENTFMVIEHPDTKLDIKVVPLALRETLKKEITIGDFYRGILAALEELPASAWHQDRNQVTGPPAVAEVIAVNCIEDARTAIDAIVEQGEGTTTSPLDAEGDPAHFYRFEEIVKGRKLIPNPNPPPDPKPDDLYLYGGDPIPCDDAGILPVVTDPDDTKYTQPAKQASDNFNYTYTTLLKTLHATFNGQPTRLGQAIGLMWSLQEQAMTVMQLPAGDGSGKNAGPTFKYQPVNPAHSS